MLNIIIKMQIKTTVRYHLTAVRMAIIKISTHNKCCRGCEKKGNLLHYWLEFKWILPLWKTVWRFLWKLGLNLSYDPAVLLLGIYSVKTTILKDTFTPLFTAAIFTVARTRKQPRCPSTDEWYNGEPFSVEQILKRQPSAWNYLRVYTSMPKPLCGLQ